MTGYNIHASDDYVTSSNWTVGVITAIITVSKPITNPVYGNTLTVQSCASKWRHPLEPHPFESLECQRSKASPWTNSHAHLTCFMQFHDVIGVRTGLHYSWKFASHASVRQTWRNTRYKSCSKDPNYMICRTQ